LTIVSAIKAGTTRHPARAYYALAFAISWGGVLIVVGPSGFPGTSEELERLMPYAILVFAAGPALAGPLSTSFAYGKAGLREFLSRLLKWRVGGWWYGVAFLAAPLLMTAVLLALSLFSREFVPGIFTSDDKTTLLLVGLATALAAGFLEELGWTGFAIPALRQHHGVLSTGLIAGVLWGAWHLLVYFWTSGTVIGALALAGYLLDAFLFLTLFRVLMVWVYDRTESLLVAMLMHASLTASARILMPPATAGMRLLMFDLVWVAALCVVIAAVAWANTGQLSRLLRQRRMA
jgi:membrane protease YdiL (CAAX protease family)